MNRRPGVLISALALSGAALPAGHARAQALAGAPDRYGAEPRQVADLRPVGVAASAPPLRLRTRFLTWPGKVQPTAPTAGGEAVQPVASPTYGAAPSTRRARPPLWNPSPVVDSRQAARAGAYGRRPAPEADRRALPTSIYSPAATAGGFAPHAAPARVQPAPAGWAPYSPALARAADRASATVYTPTGARSYQTAASPLGAGQGGARQPTASPTVATRALNPNGVRFYSVHRPFGLTPDPAPIPPQFFAATPDLGDPPGPGASRRTVAGAGLSTVAARNAAVSAQTAQSADADADAPPQP